MSGSPAAGRAAVLAVDGGNSKTEVVLIDRSGTVLGAARGPGSNHSHSDHDSVMRLIDDLIAQAAAGTRAATSSTGRTGRTGGIAEVAVLCLAGADFPRDERRLAATAASFGWAAQIVVCNDAFAILRAGTDSDMAIALVCGAGVNCVGRGARGRTVRFPALGDISGDWGGGYDIGMAALAAAVRAEDGRGPKTALRELVPRHFGMARPASLVTAVYTGRIDLHRMTELPSVVFAAADDGDEAARGIVGRLNIELVTMAAATLRRLRLTRVEVDVVLGGGVLTSGYQPIVGPVTAGILRVAPQARVKPLATPAVTGSALLGLDELGLVPTIDVRAAMREAINTKEAR
jgi:N-acetylglucosamine kinase-like BadF-type ATPase